MSRKEGYYWVRVDEDWYICEWNKVAGKSYWTFTGAPIRHQDDYFDEINEERIKSPIE